VAIGTVTGGLTAADGTVRNVVFQAALPLDVTGTRARLNTDPVLAQGSCSVLHVELAATMLNVLGSTLGLNPVSFDIISAVQAGTSTGGTSPAATMPIVRTATTGSTASSAVASSPQAGTMTSSVTTNTTQATNAQFASGVATPGAATPVPAAAPATVQPQVALGSLLCSVNNFSDVSNPAQLIQQLNGIVIALATSGP